MSSPDPTHDDNIELVRFGIEAFNRGDEEALLERFHPRVESRVGPGLMNSGTWFGHDGFREMVTIWGEAWETNEQTLVDVIAPDEYHVIAEIQQQAVGAGSGVPVAMTIHYLLDIREGLVMRFHIYGDRAGAFEAIR